MSYLFVILRLRAGLNISFSGTTVKCICRNCLGAQILQNGDDHGDEVLKKDLWLGNPESHYNYPVGLKMLPCVL